MRHWLTSVMVNCTSNLHEKRKGHVTVNISLTSFSRKKNVTYIKLYSFIVFLASFYFSAELLSEFLAPPVVSRGAIAWVLLSLIILAKCCCCCCCSSFTFFFRFSTRRNRWKVLSISLVHWIALAFILSTFLHAPFSSVFFFRLGFLIFQFFFFFTCPTKVENELDGGGTRKE